MKLDTIGKNIRKFREIKKLRQEDLAEKTDLTTNYIGMISVGNKEVTAIRVGERVVATVYIGARLVWQAIRSCFGAGFWRGDKPWSRTDGWKRMK